MCCRRIALPMSGEDADTDLFDARPADDDERVTETHVLSDGTVLFGHRVGRPIGVDDPDAPRGGSFGSIEIADTSRLTLD